MSGPLVGLEHDDRLAARIARWRRLVPLLTCVVALFVMTMPLITSAPLMPHLALLTVLIWGLFQPALMPAHLALLLGVLTDAVLGLPLGVNALLMPITTIAVGALERRYGHRPYALDWALVALLVFAYEVLTWQLIGFTGGELPFTPLLWQAVTTVLAYPFVVAIIAGIQRRWGDR
ncbi:rod shape-determining protein MreD [Sphingoaurantiacus capsulatus]|uniref:Rod shape-determining protein MreD n=1 Tax=Sphingoaurantiacus capsulatus TaxID=1771310 RepID=A0ABV7XD33_9SPHN